ncbi:hypothetical protein BRARA_J00532 [Brassica rapa]|uniref:Uncharacterized protein n=1 Tax=Brassica campestris TaxID=3711 RepID=A0A397XIE7_BRACM|nr:hypothetical protein BRARA_J00532 [Brassica rapa]
MKQINWARAKRFVGLQFQQQTLVDLCDSRNKLWKEFCFTQSKGGGVVIRDEFVVITILEHYPQAPSPTLSSSAPAPP